MQYLYYLHVYLQSSTVIVSVASVCMSVRMSVSLSVKVMAAKKREIPYNHNVKLQSSIMPVPQTKLLSLQAIGRFWS